MQNQSISIPVRLRPLLALALMSAPLWAWSQAEDAGVLLDGVTAQVDEVFILVSDVADWLRENENVQRFSPLLLSDPEFNALFEKGRDALIDTHLIIKAYRDSGAQLQPWVVEQRISEVIETVFQGDRSRLLDELSRLRMTFEDWRRRIEEQVIVASMRNSHAEQPAVATPDAIQTYYTRNRNRFIREAGVHMRLIVLRPADASPEARAEAQRRARNVWELLRQGAEFPVIAQRHSQGSRAASGGEWGWVNPEQDLRSELAHALSTLLPGEFTDVIETAEEFYIVQKVADRERKPLPLEEVWNEISMQLQRENSRHLYDAWILRLRNQARILLFDLS